ncbi:MAG: ATP-dependent Clp protease proteolytic subunit [Thermoplasmata archaeon]
MKDFHTEPQYEQSCCEIRLLGEINNHSIFLLCDEIDLAIDYYQYKKIDIQIDSHGGSIASLDYYLSKLDRWRKKGIIIGTLGLTSVASAAAIILALGTVGYRRAYGSSMLLYHNTRIEREKWVATKDSLQFESDALDRTDKRLIKRMIDHVDEGILSKHKIDSLSYLDFDYKEKKYLERTFFDLEGITRETLEKYYNILFSYDCFIAPTLAKGMLLIDHIQEEFELDPHGEATFKELI